MPDEDLPPLQAAWMTALLGEPLPRETEATCAACPMLPSDAAPPGATFFDPATKCCTYLPVLHNFLVGRALREPDSPGRATVVARIERGVEVTPLGLLRPRAFLLAYQGGHASFGRNRSLRCPHYLDDGRCGVWQARESTCATWFCKHARGKTGADLWSVVHRLLSLLEHRLAIACAAGRAWDPARATDFYLACASHADTLPFPEVLALGGADAAALAAELTDRVAASRVVPPRLIKGAIQIAPAGPDAVAVVTYNGYDPIELPRELVALLDRFDGRPTADVLAAIESDDGIELEPALIRRLVDFAVLVAQPDS